MKKAMKEHPCFDGFGLDITIYLRWVQILRIILRPSGTSMKSIVAYLLKNSMVMPDIGLETFGEKELFKIGLESRLEIGSNHIWIRDSIEIYSWKKISFLSKRKSKLKRKSFILM